MLPKHKLSIVLMMIIISVGILAFGMANRPTAAQDRATLRGLLETLKGGTNTVTIQFAVPLVPGENTWVLPDQRFNRTLAEIGDDYVCFSEPWNNTTRLRCTPFGNIIGVTFSP
ncbi:MAG: hypothetical protein K8L97_00330 [Anaerolineae bacterium]|nr:hypothetical protein [Anaerolineae bacterium]